MKLIACSSGKYLGEKISGQLKTTLLNTTTKVFSNGEIKPVLEESVRNENVYLIQSFSKNINTDLMEIILTADAIKRSSGNEITLIMPYFPYGRQERQTEGKREPISARVVASLLEQNGIDKLITMDLHSTAIQGFFKIPCDNISAKKILAGRTKELVNMENSIIISPDFGGTKRAREFSKLLNLTLGIGDKRRSEESVEILSLTGDITGKNAIIFDDMVDTGGTLIENAKALKEKGAEKIIACFTHPIFSKGFEHLENSGIDLFIATNSIESEIQSQKLATVDISSLLSEVITRHEEGIPLTELQ